jgi:hypothetical protein
MAAKACFAALATMAVALSGCSGDSETRQTGNNPPSSVRSDTTPATASAEARERTCPVTLANHSVPPNATGWEETDSHGNGKLWTGFWPYNLVIADSGYVAKDGAIGMKWPWWRGVRGELQIEGLRLDAKAPAITADIASGYGESGFQPSGINFPTEGCWRVTGSVGGATLTFVTLVVKASTYALELKRE